MREVDGISVQISVQTYGQVSAEQPYRIALKSVLLGERFEPVPDILVENVTIVNELVVVLEDKPADLVFVTLETESRIGFSDHFDPVFRKNALKSFQISVERRSAYIHLLRHVVDAARVCRIHQHVCDIGDSDLGILKIPDRFRDLVANLYK